MIRKLLGPLPGLLLAVATSALAAAPAQADLAKAIAAYRASDFATATSELQTDLKAGNPEAELLLVYVNLGLASQKGSPQADFNQQQQEAWIETEIIPLLRNASNSGLIYAKGPLARFLTKGGEWSQEALDLLNQASLGGDMYATGDLIQAACAGDQRAIDATELLSRASSVVEKSIAWRIVGRSDLYPAYSSIDDNFTNVSIALVADELKLGEQYAAARKVGKSQSEIVASLEDRDVQGLEALLAPPSYEVAEAAILLGKALARGRLSTAEQNYISRAE